MPTPKPPIAAKKPRILAFHGDERTDEYYWLRERENPEVIRYLEAENSYYREMTSHTKEFQEVLFQEMKSRIREDDTSVPYKLSGYWYITRFETGREYPVYARKRESMEAEEEILFDANLLAAGHDYFDLRGISVSPDNRLAAFGTDVVSRRLYEIRIKDLETGEVFEDLLEHTTGSSVWATDNRTLFYTRKDPETLRADSVYKHRLGTPASEDELVYRETDDTFNTYVYKSKSRKFIIIGSFSTLTSEYRILPADQPDGDFRVFSARERGVEYSIYHYGDWFYVLTNRDGAINFKVMRTREDSTDSRHWEPFIPHRETVLIEDLDIFSDYYVVSERDNGLSKMRIVRWDGREDYYLPFDNETYVAYPYINLDFDTENLRYVYNAMTSPYSIVEFNMATRQKTILKEQEVLGGNFRKENYRSLRMWATARDGVRVPISLVYHRETPLDGTSPLLLYGYGSYGSTTDPYFSTVRLSLLDRGFIYAIAHIRGGEYLGRPWYEEGKLLKKWNTFTDFVDCARYLIAEKFTSPEHIYAYGGSAGGLLMGAVVNEAPELFRGVIAAVPFVDVVTTMLDESIPLTTGEYDEWGNPADPEFYDYMKSYSPYDNVREQTYPHLLVTTGLHDSQVQYWEPAKWVARLRCMKKGNNLLFLHTNMEAGHGGASGRFEALRETAMEYAFLLDLEGKVP
ncbi:S9 family peptidase [Robiginitalea sp. SC105]|uniref:S9 family peptidase n=1 Tax=Robiginitalea sp. SC105 TaxID=2762332 RepID=UPI00163A27F4|nr:S9 family peptidase [Robiginitalea sp. SC105]MBC2840678.1 S9 family peptidase [Robiginitalea sp. SC105]